MLVPIPARSFTAERVRSHLRVCRRSLRASLDIGSRKR